MITGKRFVIDIDGVITLIDKNCTNYTEAKPNYQMIEKINKLYDAGNTIVYFTARGYVTGIDWREVTENCFEKWGVKYHELIFGKPNADYYIDDRMLSFDGLDEMVGNKNED